MISDVADSCGTSKMLLLLTGRLPTLHKSFMAFVLCSFLNGAHVRCSPRPVALEKELSV